MWCISIYHLVGDNKVTCGRLKPIHSHSPESFRQPPHPCQCASHHTAIEPYRAPCYCDSRHTPVFHGLGLRLGSWQLVLVIEPYPTPCYCDSRHTPTFRGLGLILGSWQLIVWVVCLSVLILFILFPTYQFLL